MIYQPKNSVGTQYLELVRFTNLTVEAHIHRHFEIVYVRQGKIKIDRSQSQEIIRAGEFAFIQSNQVHSYVSEGETLMDICVFSGDLIPSFESKIKNTIADKVKFVCNPSITQFLENNFFKKDNFPDFYTAKAALYAMLGEINSQIVFSKNENPNSIILSNLVNYVENHFTQDISLATAATELGYDRNYLSRVFHSVIPIHFTQYVNLHRIEYAVSLLQQSDLSITEIAFESGFNSIRTFNRIFYQINHKTPTEYKEAQSSLNYSQSWKDQFTLTQ